MVVLTLANLVVTVMRFVAMRLWVFARPAAAAWRKGQRPTADGGDWLGRSAEADPCLG